jgi:hypothetical protein
MVELVELFIAAGLLVGAASHPATNSVAPSVIEIKVGFIFVPVLAATTYPTAASPRQMRGGNKYFFGF